MASKTATVAAWLRALVASSEPGAELPSESELMAEHKVSRTTARNAMARLAREGLVEGDSGQRWTVRAYKPLFWDLSKFERGQRRDDPSTGTDEWTADMASQGVQTRYDVSVQIMAVPNEFARSIGVPAGTTAVRRRRLRYADDVPVAIADTWVREEIGRMTVNGRAPLLEVGNVTLPGGIFAALGLPMRDLLDEVTVRMPTPEEERLLDLSEGSPVGQLTRTGFLKDGSPIRTLATVFPGHRLKLRYKLGV